MSFFYFLVLFLLLLLSYVNGIILYRSFHSNCIPNNNYDDYITPNVITKHGRHQVHIQTLSLREVNDRNTKYKKKYFIRPKCPDGYDIKHVQLLDKESDNKNFFSHDGVEYINEAVEVHFLEEVCTTRVVCEYDETINLKKSIRVLQVIVIFILIVLVALLVHLSKNSDVFRLQYGRNFIVQMWTRCNLMYDKYKRKFNKVYQAVSTEDEQQNSPARGSDNDKSNDKDEDERNV